MTTSLWNVYRKSEDRICTMAEKAAAPTESPSIPGSSVAELSGQPEFPDLSPVDYFKTSKSKTKSTSNSAEGSRSVLSSDRERSSTPSTGRARGPELWEYFDQYVQKVGQERYFCHLCRMEGGISHYHRHLSSDRHLNLLNLFNGAAEGENSQPKSKERSSKKGESTESSTQVNVQYKSNSHEKKHKESRSSARPSMMSKSSTVHTEKPVGSVHAGSPPGVALVAESAVKSGKMEASGAAKRRRLSSCAAIELQPSVTLRRMEAPVSTEAADATPMAVGSSEVITSGTDSVIASPDREEQISGPPGSDGSVMVTQVVSEVGGELPQQDTTPQVANDQSSPGNEVTSTEDGEQRQFMNELISAIDEITKTVEAAAVSINQSLKRVVAQYLGPQCTTVPTHTPVEPRHVQTTVSTMNSLIGQAGSAVDQTISNGDSDEKGADGTAQATVESAVGDGAEPPPGSTAQSDAEAPRSVAGRSDDGGRGCRSSPPSRYGSLGRRSRSPRRSSRPAVTNRRGRNARSPSSGNSRRDRSRNFYRVSPQPRRYTRRVSPDRWRGGHRYQSRQSRRTSPPRPASPNRDVRRPSTPRAAPVSTAPVVDLNSLNSSLLEVVSLLRAQIK